MWVYYYVSKVRISQLSEQISVKLPVEEIKKWDIQGKATACAEGEISRLLEWVGLKGKATTTANGGITRSSESKFTASDESIVERVRQHLIGHEGYSNLTPNSEENQVSELRDVVRFCGDFSPNIPGKGTKRIATFLEMDYLQWQGRCGEVDVTFVTSRDSLVSSTALISFLADTITSLRLDGFATLLEGQPQTPCAILPLFFGREIDQDEWL